MEKLSVMMTTIPKLQLQGKLGINLKDASQMIGQVIGEVIGEVIGDNLI
jgi:hypothetical protein